MKVLMVCLGNICRSPMAEGMLRQLAEIRGIELDVDSCGTAGYHIGSPPDQRAIQAMAIHGMDISPLRARQFRRSDFVEFDFILTMDRHNYEDVLELANSPAEANKVHLMLNFSFPNQNLAVPDPYFGGDDGFEEVFRLLNEACNAFLDQCEKAC